MSRHRRRAPRAIEPAAAKEVEPALQLLNRELSWLEFNQRVLAQAQDPATPPLERLKFLAIVGSNLDEFFMKRIGGLRQQLASNLRHLSPDGRSPRQQLDEIVSIVRPMVAEQHRVFTAELVPELRRNGLDLLRWHELRDSERSWLRLFFERSIFPILTPLALDPAHPFPFISNLSLSLAVAVRHPETGQERFARVKIPKSLPRWIQLPNALRFIPLEDVVAHHLDQLFPGMEIAESHAFRVTRNADIERNEEPAEDLLEAIQEELRERRFATVVRLQVQPEMPRWMRTLLCEELEAAAEDVFEVPPPLGLADSMQLTGLPLWEIRDAPWRPVTVPRLQPAAESDAPPDIFAVIRSGDLLVHHPYDSFATSVQRFIETAARDPQVLAIKQTLYRTSRESPIVGALIAAAESGKQVAVTVELKARFDEERNIEWAQALEEAGAHVAYGVVGLKTHAKVSLVVRQEADGLRTYSHIATGNYNTDTANLYTDVGIFTCNPAIGADVGQLFNLLTGYVLRPQFAKLLVAPATMRAGVAGLIAREAAHASAGRGGRIMAKMNSLEDPRIIRALYEAAAAGVEIDLVVRGVCRLRPGVPQLSETIRVISIVGRFLEHARIFHFANAGEPEAYLGSADWMSRNLDYRVEAMVPVEAPALQEELRAILELQLQDNARAWDLRGDGSYLRRQPAAGEPVRDSQADLMARSLRRAARR